MDPLTIAAAAAAVSSLMSVFGGFSAKSAAERAAKKEAKFEGVLTLAKLENLEKEERVLKGQTIAIAAGSGVKVDKGSPLQVLAEQAREFQRERHTVAKVGATRAAQSMARGRMVGDQAVYQGISQGASQMANAFTMFKK